VVALPFVYDLGTDLAVFVRSAPLLEGEKRVVWTKHGRAELWVAPEAAGYSDGILLHLAFLAELRRLMNAPAERWQVLQAGETDPTGLVPDAVFQGPEGPVAVEVDLGYALDRVKGKVRHYARHYAGQVWGVLTSARASRVRLEALLIGSEVQVHLLDKGLLG